MRRSIHALIGVLVLGLTAPAYACNDKEPKEDPNPPLPTACNLLIDPAGDAQFSVKSGDILSGDVATGATTLVAVLRLGALTGQDAGTLTGQRWNFSFAIGKASYTAFASRDATGATTGGMTRSLGSQAQPVGPVKFFFDATESEIVWMVPRVRVPELNVEGTTAVFQPFWADTYASPADLKIDSAKTAARYVDGQPSCVSAK